ncbi:MAG TPA: DUF4136 domain-containing protein [Vicinamibacterales bacterium]|nr:DUF4136 domain-containing protein [Vicinamibacterales bacterium]
MKRVFLIAAALLTVATMAWAQDVRYNFDKSANFSKYKTFKWVENKSGDQLDSLTKGDIQSAMEAELAKKGLQKSTTDAADLYITFAASVSTEKQVNTFDTGYGAGPGWYGPYGYGGWSGGSSTSTTYTIYNGTVVVDMYDVGTKQLVWRGAVSKELDVNAKPDKRAKNIKKATEKLFKNYPPPPPKDKK